MYLHKGDFIPTTTFFDSECEKDFVYVEGLLKNHYLSSSTPFLLQKDNGVMVSVDHTFSELTHYDQNHTIVDTIKLNFITQCTNQTTNFEQITHQKVPQAVSSKEYGFMMGGLLVVVFVGIIMVRKLQKKV